MFEIVTNVLDSVSYIWETYGWYILGITLAVIIFYRKFIRTSLENYFEQKHEEEIKKFDADSRDKYAEKMKLAREKQYQQFVKEMEEKKARAEEMKKQKEAEEEAARKLEKAKGKVLAETVSKAQDSSENAMDFIAKKITGKKVVIFSKKGCPFCMKAKQALAVYRIPPNNYEIVELDGFPAKFVEEIQTALGELTGATTVPRVFINSECIGGGDETVKALGTGELAKLLKECGAI